MTGDGGRLRRAQAPRLHRLTIAVTLLALAITGALSWAAYTINDHSEDRLLHLKVAETGAVLQTAVPQLQTPLTSVAEFAAASSDATGAFRQYIAGYVGARKTFASASLWRLRAGSDPQLVTVVGIKPLLADMPSHAATFLSRAAREQTLSVLGMLSGPQRRLGYAYAVTSPTPTYIVYAESLLPTDPKIPVTTGTPFSDLRFALYLGKQPSRATLIEENVRHPGPRTASVTVPLGDQFLTVVASPAGNLGGALSNSAWWIVAVIGGVLSLGAGAVSERLVRRRLAAESLTVDVQNLLLQQRAISETLQRAMVPPPPPVVPGLDIAARYVPGAAELEIGGDWYDVIEMSGGRTFLSIGDVSGRGLLPGAVMSSLRSAVRAFVSEGHGPGSVLDRVSRLLDTTRSGYFATMLCLVLDRPNHRLLASCAGHLPPLLIAGEQTHYLELPAGPPIGATTDAPPYRERVIELPDTGSLLLFTDGLVERRGEVIDVGLDRLAEAARDAPEAMDELLASVSGKLEETTPTDDTAMLGVRWT